LRNFFIQRRCIHFGEDRKILDLSVRLSQTGDQP
jgi:hypothetical protein